MSSTKKHRSLNGTIVGLRQVKTSPEHQVYINDAIEYLLYLNAVIEELLEEVPEHKL